MIDMGSAQGLQQGSRLAVYKATDPNTRVGVIEVTQVVDTRQRARPDCYDEFRCETGIFRRGARGVNETLFMARFVITDPSARTQIFEITSPTISVGRADSNDLVLRHPSVSRHHVRITVLPGDITLLNDLGSMNGTFVNNVQIQEHRLKDQDRVAIGMYELKYETTRAGDLHIEAGSGTVTDVNGLVGAEDISTALRLTAPTAPIAPVPIEERVKALEKENNLLKLLLAVGKTLSSVLMPDEIMHRVMELVFQMDNVERGFVMLRDDKKGFQARRPPLQGRSPES